MLAAPAQKAPETSGNEFPDRALQALDPFCRDAHRFDHLLERDLMCGMIETLL